jgi:hypothetical protein
MHGVEIIEIVCIAIAAFVMASDEALRRTSNLSSILPRLQGLWRFLPAALVSIAALLFIAQKLGLPNYEMSLPIEVWVAIGLLIFIIAAGSFLTTRNRGHRQPAQSAQSLVAAVPPPPSAEQVLVPQDTYYLHDATAAGYPHKLKIVLRIESAGDVIVTSAEWQDTWNLTLPPLNEHLWQSEGPRGWQNDDWGGETHEALVRPGRAIQTWVGLPSPLDEVELRRRIMTKRLGTLIVPLTIDGRTTLETIKL